VPRVKVYGERNSGTRYLSALLAANFRLDLLRDEAPRVVTWLSFDSQGMRDWYFALTGRRNLGWKHRLPPSPDELAALGERARDVRFVTLVKNPYSWLLSLLRRPYNAVRPYASVTELVTAPWVTVGRERAPPAFADAVAMWNAKAAANLALPAGRTANLRYEDLLADPAAEVLRLERDLGFERRGHELVNVEASTKRSAQTFDDYRRYYLEERWRERLSPAEVALISERLDPAVMQACRYKVL
jgi:hypothetical protein